MPTSLPCRKLSGGVKGLCWELAPLQSVSPPGPAVRGLRVTESTRFDYISHQRHRGKHSSCSGGGKLVGASALASLTQEPVTIKHVSPSHSSNGHNESRPHLVYGGFRKKWGKRDREQLALSDGAGEVASAIGPGHPAVRHGGGQGDGREGAGTA